MRALKLYLGVASLFLFLSCFSQNAQAQNACSWQQITVTNVSDIRELADLNTRRNNIARSSVLANIEISPIGSYVATTYHDSAATNKQVDIIQTWEIGETKLLNEFTESDGVVQFLFSPDEHYLVVSGFSSVSIREVTSGLEVQRWDNYPSDLHNTNFSSDGRLLALSNLRTDDVTFWNMQTNTEFAHMQKPYVNRIAFAPNNRQVALGSQHGSIDLLDIGNNEIGDPINVYQGNFIDVLTFDSTGKNLLFVDSQTVGILNLSTHDLTKLDYDAANTYVLSHAFNNVVAFSGDGIARLLDVSLDEAFAEIQGQLLAINPDETIYASRSDDFATNESVLELRSIQDSSLLSDIAHWSFPATTSDVSLVTFSPDNRYLATGNADGVVKFWGVAETDNCS